MDSYLKKENNNVEKMLGIKGLNEFISQFFKNFNEDMASYSFDQRISFILDVYFSDESKPPIEPNFNSSSLEVKIIKFYQKYLNLYS